MSLIPAAKKQIAQLKEKNPIRLVLEFLLVNGVGHNNAVRLKDLEIHLRENGVIMEVKKIQQQVLAASRKGDFFIGTCHKGAFLIDTKEDFDMMSGFYVKRIAQEQANLAKLQALRTTLTPVLPPASEEAFGGTGCGDPDCEICV